MKMTVKAMEWKKWKEKTRNNTTKIKINMEKKTKTSTARKRMAMATNSKWTMMARMRRMTKMGWMVKMMTEINSSSP